jgi:dienelactone hydrolase
MVSVAPHGSWKSPITARLIAEQSIALRELAIDDEDIYWVESHPVEGGRCTIMQRARTGVVTERTPAGFNVRTRVHEYGGGAFTVEDGTIYFANSRDQRLYRQPATGAPEPLTSRDGYRYADLELDRRRGRLICIGEDHSAAGEAVNTIVGINLAGGSFGTVLAAGSDFYSNPRLSPDGNRLVYLTWNHPNMPWDGCELWEAELDAEGGIRTSRHVAGGRSESICQPEWSPDGTLHFVDERTGWWNLYRWSAGRIEPLCTMEAEFATPQWVFGLSTYDFAVDGRILCTCTMQGIQRLGWVDTSCRKMQPIALPFTEFSHVRCAGDFAVFFAGGPAYPPALLRMDLHTNQTEVIREAFDASIDSAFISLPRHTTYPNRAGRPAHGFYYAERNPEFLAPPGDLAPLIVMSHRGPTSAALTSLRYDIQFWTSRGFAVLDVNHGGSSGYGRDYRRSLNGQWGVLDVDDCCSGAMYLAQQGLVDGNRLIIRGASAGGYTTLACLTFRPEVFKAGASRYGVADLESLARDTHKFESHYLFSLIGPYPERRDLYLERSPIHSVDRLACPLILFQGDEDEVVPPRQSEMLFDAVRGKGLPAAYILFHGEQHGFQRAENIQRALEAELFFYSKILGFRPADDIEPVDIGNL